MTGLLWRPAFNGQSCTDCIELRSPAEAVSMYDDNFNVLEEYMEMKNGILSIVDKDTTIQQFNSIKANVIHMREI